MHRVIIGIEIVIVTIIPLDNVIQRQIIATTTSINSIK